MSGGKFNYNEWYIEEIADDIGFDISSQLDETYDTPKFSDEVVQEMINGYLMLKIAYIYARRIDRFMSGDNGEDDFLELLNGDLEELHKVSASVKQSKEAITKYFVDKYNPTKND